MNEKLCTTCGGKISPARIALIKDCEECTTCASLHDVEKVKGYMTWEHKTAPTLVIDTAKNVNEFLSMTRRRPSPQLPFSPRKGISSLAESQTRQQQDATLSVEHTGAVDMLKARCHPLRERVTPDGKCVECALEWYKRRVGK